jgi:hypothetical protein
VTVAGDRCAARASLPSGTAAAITLLHDCSHPARCASSWPTPKAPALEVREVDQEGPLKAPAASRRVVDGGMATSPVCGKAPARLDPFRPTRDLVGR